MRKSTFTETTTVHSRLVAQEATRKKKKKKRKRKKKKKKKVVVLVVVVEICLVKETAWERSAVETGLPEEMLKGKDSQVQRCCVDEVGKATVNVV